MQHYMLWTSTVYMYILYHLLMLTHITHTIIALMNSLRILYRTQLEETITVALCVQHKNMSPLQLECQYESSAHMLSAKYTYFHCKIWKWFQCLILFIQKIQLHLNLSFYPWVNGEEFSDGGIISLKML